MLHTGGAHGNPGHCPLDSSVPRDKVGAWTESSSDCDIRDRRVKATSATVMTFAGDLRCLAVPSPEGDYLPEHGTVVPLVTKVLVCVL